MLFPTIRSATKSLWHHVLFVLVFASLPISILFIAWAYQDNDLTAAHVIWIIGVWVSAGVIGALFGWYVILAPIRGRPDHRKDGGGK